MAREIFLVSDLKFVLGDIYQDAALLQRASDWADKILAEDKELSGKEYQVLRESLARDAIKEVDFRTI